MAALVIAIAFTVASRSEKALDENKTYQIRSTSLCKAVLDEAALRIQRERNGNFVIVRYTDELETITATQTGTQRAVNVKHYLVNGEGGRGIDVARRDSH
jgi:hypothetical protein